MQEQEPIRLSVQLPSGALDSFTRLVEQLRQLAAELGGGGPEPASGSRLERGESTSFDLGRFQALGQGPEEPRSVRAPVSEVDGAEPVRAPVRKAVPAPESAWEGAVNPAADPALPLEERILEREAAPTAEAAAPPVSQEMDDPRAVRAEATGDDFGAVPVRTAVERAVDEAQAVQAEPEENLGKIPAVRAEAESRIGDAPAVRMEPESQIPEAEAGWDAELEQLDAPAGVQTEVSSGAAAPQAAGYAVLTDPEAARNRWSDVSEELFLAGPAPLTAEAVSLAFRRDDRRYDSGFPLY